MHDVAVVERRVLPAKEARVVLIDEKREMRTKCAAFIAEALGKRGVNAHEPVECLSDRACVDRHVAGAARETAINAVQQHPHARATIGKHVFRHRPFTLSRATISL